jgi:hypothetical protein
MKNTHSPTAENFILTHKKRRMIKGLMREFVSNHTGASYSECDGKHIPEPTDLAIFLRERLMFLKNVQLWYGIEIIKGIFTGVAIYTGNECIFEETIFRQKFTKRPEPTEFLKFEFKKNNKK